MDIPVDWEHPKWEERERIHNWRNYVSEDLKNHWENLSDTTKQVVSANLEDIASREEWD